MDSFAKKPELTDREVLAAKLELLLDYARGVTGDPLQYPRIRDELAKRGLSVSRTRWHRLRSGSPANKWDPQLIEAVADFLDVPARYLLVRDAELPAKRQAEIRLLWELRASKVQNFAARTLGDVGPETLNELTSILKKHREIDQD